MNVLVAIILAIDVLILAGCLLVVILLAIEGRRQ
jgi:hypothetical protein